METKKNAADFLVDIGDIYRERKPLYGDNYKHVGKIGIGLFPEGLKIETEEEWNRLHLVFHMISKLTRYAQNLKRGGHQDSLDDLAVYAMLARECDIDFAEARKPVPADPVAVDTKSPGAWGVMIYTAGMRTDIFNDGHLDRVNERLTSPLSHKEAFDFLRGRAFDNVDSAVEQLVQMAVAK